jgi:hypothetical protein
MLLFGHLGIGLGLAWLLSWKSPTIIDYRLVLFGAILPDLIDKPLGYFLGIGGRTWSHTFLFLYAILALSFVPRLTFFRLIGFGVATHLLLDQMWNLPRIVLYPAYGWTFPREAFTPDVWFDALLHDPYVQFGEIAGIAILVAFAFRMRIRSVAAFVEFVRHGTVSPEREA